ncbi:hypothetical protein F4804DRAFT_323938 [Jackrogersella minutella]|nr:hypothetical protein F4804DRAFT_323938 [Jackrogersella minutella]
MYAFAATTLALAGLAAAAPTLQDRQESQFRLHATGVLAGWALVNAHVDAGRNTIQIQRPSAYQSDISYLNGTNLYFDLGTTIPYGVRIPDVAEATVGEVFSQSGEMSPGFSINADQFLVYDHNTEGFWACSVNNTFELFYGLNPDPGNLPGECIEIELQVSSV